MRHSTSADLAFPEGSLAVPEHADQADVSTPSRIEKRPLMSSNPTSRNDTPLYVCHSHLRWDWVYQRPQHLLSRLARHAPVLVEEEPVFDDRPPGLDALH